MGSASVPPDIVVKEEDRPQQPRHVDRETVCFSQPSPGLVLEKGHKGFREELSRLSSSAESNATEALVQLKRRLRHAEREEFFSIVTEGMAKIADAQYGFVSKRILADESGVNVEMPPYGTPGSCLMAAAFYYSNDADVEGVVNNMKYHAWGCPCAYMKQGKVFVVPERMDEFIVDNPNGKNFIVPAEGYLGIPLYHEGRCFAHFGVMWSREGIRRRSLSWPFLELLLHSLEDVILEKILEGLALDEAKAREEPKQPQQPRVVPHQAVNETQSLKPYARSLSHELRTPMQGVVGMLDVMHATVQEAAEGVVDPRMRKIFQTLRENIEVVQDSSRRAVEAADNVVHAYDMNMGVPDTPLSPMDEDTIRDPAAELAYRQKKTIVVTGNNIPINFRGLKRRRDEIGNPPASPAKRPAYDRRGVPELSGPESRRPSVHKLENPEDAAAAAVAAAAAAAMGLGGDVRAVPRTSLDQGSHLSSPLYTTEHTVVPGLRHTDLRDVLQYVVNDSLKVGGRPESAIARETEIGEHIEVRLTDSAGAERVKAIEWSVDPGVPETMLIDEKDLAKMVSCVFLNAVKFTEQGRITVTARLSPKARYVVINIMDQGPGIPEAFLPNLFKPFSREDDSLTRQSEGLGLGLLVAKGLARKLGGDLYCVRADTRGPNRGCEFEMRVPLTPGDICSRPGSPFASPSPSSRSRHSVESDVPPVDANTGIVRGRGHSLNASDALKEALSRRLHAAQQQQLQPGQNINVQLATPTPTPAATSDTSQTPLQPQPQHQQQDHLAPPKRPASPRRRKSSYDRPRWHSKSNEFDRSLAERYPLKILVAEDNKINRKLLVNMLQKFGYRSIQEAYDGADAVRQMEQNKRNSEHIDVILMDLWMPFMDGYEAAERILQMDSDSESETEDKRMEENTGGVGDEDTEMKSNTATPSPKINKTRRSTKKPTILAVTADVTDGALERAARVGMKGFMTKPFKLLDLERLIVEYCAGRDAEHSTF